MRMKNRGTRPRARPGALLMRAALAAMTATSAISAQATISLSGAYRTDPPGLSIAGSSVFEPMATVWLGQGAQGLLLVNGGSVADLGVLTMSDPLGSALAIASVEGAGSVLRLSGSAARRFTVGDGGPAYFAVSEGALLDARGASAACHAAGLACMGVVGASAGAVADFSVIGAGSQARFLNTFAVAAGDVLNGSGYGTPGASTDGSVLVKAGGSLLTVQVQSASVGSGGLSNGQERAYALQRIEGAGSVWQVSGSEARGLDALVSTGAHARAQSEWLITDGGRLLIEAETGRSAQLRLSQGGGWTEMTVEGAASRLRLAGQEASLQLGESGGFARLSLRDGARAELAGAGNAVVNLGLAGSQGHASVSSGAQLSGMRTLNVGNGSGGLGELKLDGAGSAVSFESAGIASLSVGTRGARGLLGITGGAQMALAGAAISRLYVGDGAAGIAGSQGLLELQGAGSRLSLESEALPPGTGRQNPAGHVGWGGTGTVSISGGASLSLVGRIASPASSPTNTRLTIGQAINGAPGHGTVVVSGTGSQLSVLGESSIVYVGRGSGGTGQLSILDGARMDAMVLDLGPQYGGKGTLSMDRGRLELQGEWRDGSVGAILTLGFGGTSVGTADIAGGSQVLIRNNGTAGAGLLLGGIDNQPNGTGVLTVRGGSRIDIESAGHRSAAIIGLGGSGTATFEEQSALYVRTGEILIGRNADATGELTLRGGSVARASYVGIGYTQAGEGGQGLLRVQDSSSVAAPLIELGSRGWLVGTGRVIGQVVNCGTISPGNSPGTLTIEGGLVNLAGGRLVLEVEGDGAGGFRTDELLFTDASLVDLGSLEVSFRFLGDTDPTAFQATGGFTLERFFGLEGGSELAHGKFAAVSFSASAEGYVISDFSFSADGGASFSAAPVPEPAAWLLMAAGTAALLARRRRFRE